MKTKEHLAHFNIAGFTYYDGVECFNKLKIGEKLRLELDAENKYDARAVAIYYKNYKLGFVPRSENRIIYKLLSVGLEDRLKIRIQSVSPDDHPENQIGVVVHLIGDAINEKK
ncbi:MAG: DNA-binding protein [Flavobacteriales bacterium]|nr:MAG: DNA-binding protein [Flavobacteriales bacterium]